MKKIILAAVTCVALLGMQSKANSETCRWEEITLKEPIFLQNKGFMQYWIGKVLAICKESNGELLGTTPALLEITHVTDKSPYGCGQKIKIKLGKTDDATAKSFMTKDCRDE